MAVLRDNGRPYVQFNFQVQLDPSDDPSSIDGGFQEISGMGLEVTVSEYRAGNSKENSVMKITGMNKSADINMKRGVFGSVKLYQWLHAVRNGEQGQLKDVTVHLISEKHDQTPVMTWKLLRARPIKVTYGPLNAKGTDVALEEMVLAVERVEVE
jgi:phage tail-like protein